jgi:hypothetical protein
MTFRLIDGCPVPASIAPYIYIVLRDAGMTAESIYRGDDARDLLHAHGKRTQREIHADPALARISNPAGQSQHELRSDGVGNTGPVGRKLESWQVGVDSGGNDEASKQRIETVARKHGWRVKHPYSRGVEGHHWCFSHKPHPHSLRMRARIIRLRATLPRR